MIVQVNSNYIKKADFERNQINNKYGSGL